MKTYLHVPFWWFNSMNTEKLNNPQIRGFATRGSSRPVGILIVAQHQEFVGLGFRVEWAFSVVWRDHCLAEAGQWPRSCQRKGKKTNPWRFPMETKYLVITCPLPQEGYSSSLRRHAKLRASRTALPTRAPPEPKPSLLATAVWRQALPSGNQCPSCPTL